MRVLKDNILTFSVIGRTDKLFHIEIKALKAGMCKNGWDFTEEGIEKSKNTFLGMAILCAYKFGKIGDGHNFDLTVVTTIEALIVKCSKNSITLLK